MVETSLTNEMIESGAKLVQKLDERGLAPDAAFWLYSPELQAWKLVLAEVKMGKVGPARSTGRYKRHCRAPLRLRILHSTISPYQSLMPRSLLCLKWRCGPILVLEEFGSKIML